MTTEISITVRGIALWGHCGVTAAEREVGQLLRIDVTVVPSVATGARSDEIDGTLDYGQVVDLVRRCVEERSYNLIERLGDEIAQRLVREYEPREVTVTVTKPAPPVGIPIDAASTEVVWRA
jgi:7,8-dihydroneopterin aldolase/epimerase/oxygenase